MRLRKTRRVRCERMAEVEAKGGALAAGRWRWGGGRGSRDTTAAGPWERQGRAGNYLQIQYCTAEYTATDRLQQSKGRDGPAGRHSSYAPRLLARELSEGLRSVHVDVAQPAAPDKQHLAMSVRSAVAASRACPSGFASVARAFSTTPARQSGTPAVHMNRTEQMR